MNAPADLPRTAIDGAVHIPLALLRASPTNPRKLFDADSLRDLANSIRMHGQLQPILARPIADAKAGQVLYEVVCGQRRLRACGIAELPSVMAILRPMTDHEALEVQVIENLKRADLTELEEAEGYRQLLRAPDGLQGYANAEELAARIGKSRSYVFQRLKLLDLHDTGREALASGRIGFSVALLIARLHTADDQAKATKAIVAGWGGEPMTHKDAAEYIHRTFHLDLSRAAFKITDATLLPDAGSCRDCGKRTGANPDLFADVRQADTCTDAPCYQAKEEAHRARLKAQAQERGVEVITGAAAKKAKPASHLSSLKGYLELDRTHYSLGDKPLRKLLGKKLPEVLLFEDPHTKELSEVVREAEALALLKAAGVLKQARMPTGSAAERQAEARAKAENAWRATAAQQCVEAAAGNAGADAAYRTQLLTDVALTLWHRLSSDDEKRVERLLGWTHIGSEYAEKGNDRRKAERIRALTDGQLCQYFTACVLSSDVHVSASPYAAKSEPARLLDLATRLGVDVPAIKAAAKAEHRVATRVKAEGKATPKAGTKAGPKPPRPPAPASGELTPETALAAALKRAAGRPHSSAVKYRDPATGSTWSGRGLNPKWVTAALAAGGQLDDYLVAAPDAAAQGKATPGRAHRAATLSSAAADPFRTV